MCPFCLRDRGSPEHRLRPFGECRQCPSPPLPCPCPLPQHACTHTRAHTHERPSGRSSFQPGCRKFRGRGDRIQSPADTSRDKHSVSLAGTGPVSQEEGAGRADFPPATHGPARRRGPRLQDTPRTGVTAEPLPDLVEGMLAGAGRGGPAAPRGAEDRHRAGRLLRPRSAQSPRGSLNANSCFRPPYKGPRAAGPLGPSPGADARKEKEAAGGRRRAEGEKNGGSHVPQHALGLPGTAGFRSTLN